MGKEEKEGNYTEQVYCVRGADIPEVKEGNKGKMPTRFILPKNYAAKQLVAGDIVVEISGEVQHSLQVVLLPYRSHCWIDTTKEWCVQTSVGLLNRRMDTACLSTITGSICMKGESFLI